MQSLKKILAKQFSTFHYFYSFLGYRMFLALILSILVAVLDGFGLSMFLPMLQMVGGNEQVDPDAMGNLSFLVEGIEHLGVELNLFGILVFMLIFFILKGFMLFGTSAYKVVLQQSFVKKLRLNMLNALNNLKFKVFMESDAGRIQNTMSGEIEKIAQGYNLYMSTFQQGMMVAVYMGFAFFVDYQFAFLVSVGGLMTNLLYSALYKKTKGVSRKLTKDSNLYQGQIMQHVANFKYLRATGFVDKFSTKLNKSIEEIEISRRKIGILNSILGSAREPILIVVIVVVILVQINLLGGELGGILISLLFFYRALTSVTALQNIWNKYISTIGSFENLKSLQKEFDKAQSPIQTNIIQEFPIKLKLEDVDFYYGKTQILKNVNLEIRPKMTIAFVGESGSGKTTLVNVLSGLIPVDNGIFSIGGKDSKQLQMASFQKHIGYIAQEPVIFSDTIYNNITFWAEPNSKHIAKFREAVKQAALTEFLETLPDNENTHLGNSGINLSGGQKQRIAIARELYKDIEILIMDEATSALDSETEYSIQNSIDALKGKYTILLVAHRLSTIKNADQIVFMKKGEIESIGTFQDLLEQREDFKRMVELQEI
ncbi:MAG: ABC-type multidrug transport system fused ATPase/permease subunit [Sediminicola sp.]|jgi:subfamily B ATP-binding cassette protein MsbA|tara:strand:+ start:6256 stop:8052 length:1797 start_codon:yes stop_codon:yes gene_type:complete